VSVLYGVYVVAVVPCSNCTPTRVPNPSEYCVNLIYDVFANVVIVETSPVLFIIFLSIGTYFIIIETWLLPVKLLIFILLFFILKSILFPKRKKASLFIGRQY
jgi:hypothetical protein